MSCPAPLRPPCLWQLPRGGAASCVAPFPSLPGCRCPGEASHRFVRPPPVAGARGGVVPCSLPVPARWQIPVEESGRLVHSSPPPRWQVCHAVHPSPLSPVAGALRGFRFVPCDLPLRCSPPPAVSGARGGVVSHFLPLLPRTQVPGEVSCRAVRPSSSSRWQVPGKMLCRAPFPSVPGGRCPGRCQAVSCALPLPPRWQVPREVSGRVVRPSPPSPVAGAQGGVGPCRAPFPSLPG
jgi:hypothetical protein